MDQVTLNYISNELVRVCRFPVTDRKFFKIQIKSDDGHSTKWINITPEQFRKLEKVLLGVS
jgi:hypothetical protein